MPRVLIIDDDDMYADMLTATVEHMGHEASSALTLEGGLAEARSKRYDVVFLDVRMPDGNGLEYLPKFKECPSSPEVIIVTGAGDPDGAELAVRSGAWAYVQKGSSIKDITLPLVRALEYRREKASSTIPVVLKRDGIIGSSPKIRRSLERMAQGANSNANFLITGETGTGKELFARAIHANSPREAGAFVVVDCAALPSTLVESVLFGHEKGSFTGADRAQDGLVAQADKGTLFLDEVGEMPLAVQKNFLRVLQEHHFRPVGGQKEIKSDFRMVAATHRNLDEMAEAGRFRSDLLYRLKAFVIELPPLRECLEDIKDLAMYHMTRLCEQNKIGTKGMSPEFLEALTRYHWPGNTRELVNTLAAAIAAAREEPTLYSQHLPPHIRIYIARSSVGERPLADEPAPSEESRPVMPSLHEYRETLEKQYFRNLMNAVEGDVKTACEISGLSRSRLYDLLKKYEVARPN